MALLTVATWNVLADAYINRDAHPDAASCLLVPGARASAICDRILEFIEGLGVDVVCLQEAEPPLVAQLKARATRYKWEISWSPRGHGAPDGCLTIVCVPWALLSFETRTYVNDPGHVAQRVELSQERSRFVLFNTHLRWVADGGGTSGRQGAELADWVASEIFPTLVVGDLNASPDSEALKHLRSAGCVDIDPDPDRRTASFPVAGAVRVDYILVRGAVGTSVEIPDLVIEAARPLPDGRLPSDHAPLAGRIEA